MPVFHRHEFRDPATNSFFGMTQDYAQDVADWGDLPERMTLLWNQGDKTIEGTVDAMPLQIGPQQVLTTTFLQQVTIRPNQAPLTGMVFNRAFYCVLDHDHEVSCNGIIFLGASGVPVIQLDEIEQARFERLYHVFLDEFQVRDHIQGEMLRMLLKRLIIMTTRLARQQTAYHRLDDQQVEVIRRFHILVDQHFREKKQVSEYADMLFKSPKTLANVFAQYRHQSPLALIQDRIVTEAKRLLQYTNMSVKEIAYELGYEQVGSLHKLFKKAEGMTPLSFRQQQTQGIDPSHAGNHD